jgi:phosphate transport system permease protein
LPIQIFNWVSLPQTEYQHVAAAGILVLLVILLVLNGAAIFIRQRSQKHSRW